MPTPSSSTRSRSTRCKSCDPSIFTYTIVLWFSLFGVLMVVSFCEFNFIMRHFKFLLTITGKGFFNIFVASMFLVGNEKEIFGYLIFGGLLGLGLLFIAIGCACISSHEATQDELKKSDAKLNKSGVGQDPATEQLV